MGQWLQMTGCIICSNDNDLLIARSNLAPNALICMGNAETVDFMHQSFVTTAPSHLQGWAGDSGANVWGTDLLSPPGSAKSVRGL